MVQGLEAQVWEETDPAKREAMAACVPAQGMVAHKCLCDVVCAEFDFLLCILLGLALGTLLYMPVIGFLLWQRRKNRTGWHFFLKCWSGQRQAWEMSIFDTLLLLVALCSLHKSVLLNKLSQRGEKVQLPPFLLATCWWESGYGTTCCVIETGLAYPEVSTSELFSSPSKGF